MSRVRGSRIYANLDLLLCPRDNQEKETSLCFTCPHLEALGGDARTTWVECKYHRPTLRRVQDDAEARGEAPDEEWGRGEARPP